MLSLFRPKNPALFIAAILLIGTAGLFVRTDVEMFKGTMSLGHAPVHLAYIGLLFGHFQGLAWPRVVVHLIATYTLAMLVDRLAARLLPCPTRPRASNREELP